MPDDLGAGSSPADDEAKTASAAAEAIDGGVTDANAADSSAAGTTDLDAKSERAAGLELTLKALEQTPETPDGEASSTSGKSEEGAKDGADEKGAAPAEGEDDPDKDVPFHNHPRWQQMKSRNADLEGRVSSMEADVKQFRAIEAFRQEHRLEVDEVSDGYKIMALIKNEPAKALPYLKGLVADIEGITGHTLPEDLQAEVDAGGITEERARELSQARASTASLTAQQKEAQSRQAEERRAARSEDFARAGQSWTEKTRARDPEFALKEQLVVDRIKAIMRDDPKRTPKTVDEVHELSEQAYKDVNERLGGLSPKKPTPPTPTSMSVTAAARRDGPITPLDITEQALRA